MKSPKPVRGRRSSARLAPPIIPSLADVRAAVSPPDGAPILKLVREYFSRYGLPRRGAHVLVALSGGPDSVALLAILAGLAKQHRWTIGAAHVNYGLRGAESDGDHAFARRLARCWGVRFHSRRMTLTEKGPGFNLQSWARRGRYEFFERLADRYGYDWIATAHQLNDRAETVAAAVLDAAGTFALAGIPPRRGRIIRPLFDCPRERILRFLDSHEIPYRTDSSNRSSRYKRNRIRATILPQWSRINPAAVEGLARLGEQLWRQHEYLRGRAHRTVQTAIRANGSARLTLEVRALRRYDSALDPFVLRDLMERVGLEMVPRPGTVERFAKLRSGYNRQASGTVEQGELVIIRSKGEIAVVRRGAVRLPRRPAVKIPRNGEIATPGAVHLKTQVRESAALLSGDDRVCAQFDCDHLQGQLSLRSPEAGDRYRPIGLNGSKKLADLLADRGVPVFERPDVPILTDEAGILWPIGHPIAERAKITARTRRVLVAQVVGEGR